MNETSISGEKESPKKALCEQLRRTLRFNAIKLSPGEHTGSPLHPYNTLVFVGADLCVCPSKINIKGSKGFDFDFIQEILKFWKF